MKKVAIVMYHYVRDLRNSRYPNIKGLDYKLFKQQIEFFKHNFNVVTMEDVIAAYRNQKELPDRAILLTFDDGYIDHYTFVMPVLLEYNMQGSFFIPGKTFSESVLLDVNKVHFILACQDIDVLLGDVMKQLNYYRGIEYPLPSNKELFQEYAIENRFDNKETVFVKRILQTAIPEELRHMISSNLFSKYMKGITEEQFAKELYLNYDQIKCMKKSGMYIGIHGYDHYWLGNLSEVEMRKDISCALECLYGIVDKKLWVMNYPYGSYNQNVIDCLKGSGCCLGLCTEVGIANLEKDNLYCLPRLDTNDFPPKSENYIQYLT